MHDSPKPDLLVLASDDHATILRVHGAEARYLVHIPLGLTAQPTLAASTVARLVRGGDFGRVLVSREPVVAADLTDLDLRIPVVHLPAPVVLAAALELHRGAEAIPDTGWKPVPHRPIEARV